MTQYRKNEIFVVTYGVYADYGIKAICKARIAFDTEKVVEEFYLADLEFSGSLHQEVFYEWLKQQKYVQELANNEWNIGDGKVDA